MRKSIYWILPALLLVNTPAEAEISKEELKQALSEHPDVLLEVLREHRAEVLEIVSEAARDARVREAELRSQREAEEVDQAIANPLDPEITEETRIRGNRNARYTLVEYSDFECPYCRRGFQTVQALRNKYGDDLRFIYKHLPLEMHKQAEPAAKYMEALSMQSEDYAWQFHDAIFANQTRLGREFYLETAQKIGADIDRLLEDVKSDEVAKRIEEDMAEASKFEFTGTPGFLLNGVPVRGAYPPSKFEQIIAKIEAQEEQALPPAE